MGYVSKYQTKSVHFLVCPVAVTVLLFYTSKTTNNILEWNQV